MIRFERKSRLKTKRPALQAMNPPIPSREEESIMDGEALNLEVVEVERRTRPGCGNSSSTRPTCTCPIPVAPMDDDR